LLLYGFIITLVGWIILHIGRIPQDHEVG